MGENFVIAGPSPPFFPSCAAPPPRAPMVKTGGVFVTALTIQMVICSSLAPMVILSTYWKRMTARAAFWGTTASGVVTTIVTIKVGGGGAAFAGAGLWGITVQGR